MTTIHDKMFIGEELEAILVEKNSNAEEVKFERCIFKNAEVGDLQLNWVEFEACVFYRVAFTETALYNCKVISCNFKQVICLGVQVSGSKFNQLALVGCLADNCWIGDSSLFKIALNGGNVANNVEFKQISGNLG